MSFISNIYGHSSYQLTFGFGKTADGKCPNFLHFRGIIDEVCIFGRPFSALEIQELKDLGQPENIPELSSSFLIYLTLSFIPLIVLVVVVKRRKRTS